MISGRLLRIAPVMYLLMGCEVDLDELRYNPPEVDNSVKCTTEKDCESGICLPSGKCAERVGEGMACDHKRFCDTDLECTDGYCQKRPEIECFNDSQCSSGQCLPDGRCAPVVEDVDVVEAGQPCDNAVCAEGLKCDEGICVKP